MPVLIAKNVTIYRIPSRSLGASEEHPIFLQNPKYPVSYVLGFSVGGNPKAREFFEGLSTESVLLDKLYSIEDIRIGTRSKLEEVGEILPETYEVTPSSKEDSEKCYKKARNKFEKSGKDPLAFKGFQDELSGISERGKVHQLHHKELFYVLQLTGNGWVDYSEPNAGVDSRHTGIGFLRNLRDMGLIELKTMNHGNHPYYVKLTKSGVVLQKELNETIDKKTHESVQLEKS